MTDAPVLAPDPPAPVEEAGSRAPWVLLGLGVVLPALGEWNPFNLAVVDYALDHAWIGVFVVLVALAWLWMRHAPRSWIGAVGVAILGVALCTWLAIGAAIVAFDLNNATRPVERIVPGPGGQVQAELSRTEGDGWFLSLYSGRGTWSRHQALRIVDYVACSDSCFTPPLDVVFTDEDELSVHWAEHLVYRVEFDPDDLHVRNELCRVAETANDAWPHEAVGCLSRPTGFWGWLSDA